MEETTYRSTALSYRDTVLYSDYPVITGIGHEYRTETALLSCSKPETPCCVLLYTVSGEGYLMINGQQHTLFPGQAFMIEKPGPYAYLKSPFADHWEIKSICLNPASLTVWNDVIRQHGRIFSLAADGPVMQLWEQIYRAVSQDRFSDFFAASAKAYELQMRLHQELRQRASNDVNDNLVQLCITFMQARFRNALTLQQLADMCAVSPSLLSKRFKLYTGLSPMRYLMKLRIQKAVALLLNSTLKISEIAEATGFFDPNYFTRIFKQMMGQPPQQYRLQERLRLNSAPSVVYGCPPPQSD